VSASEAIKRLDEIEAKAKAEGDRDLTDSECSECERLVDMIYSVGGRR
jgi:hypothetical protein